MVVDDVPEPGPAGRRPDRRRWRRIVRVGPQRVPGTWTPRAIHGSEGTRRLARSRRSGNEFRPRGIGETVVLEANTSCWHVCPQCRRGWTSACLRRQSVGMNRQGAMRSASSSRPQMLGGSSRPRPSSLSVEPLTVVETALRRLPTPIPDAALVIGVGAQGLLMCLALLRRGVAVFVEDINKNALPSQRASVPAPSALATRLACSN